MHQFISETAKFGDLTRGPRIITAETRARMEEILKEIQTGQFAEEWMAEYKAGTKNYAAMKARDLDHQVQTVGADLRSRMPWLTA
jgi:ketol-acid reductoisomerase